MACVSGGMILRWSDFSRNAGVSFAALRQSGDFFDVSLLCSDDDQHGDGLLRAHRLVLAASSPFFTRALRKCERTTAPGQHAVLMMPPGVSPRNLTRLVDFIYNGQVTVPEDEMDALLMAAGILQVRGLVNEEQAERPPCLPASTKLNRPPPALQQAQMTENEARAPLGLHHGHGQNEPHAYASHPPQRRRQPPQSTAVSGAMDSPTMAKRRPTLEDHVQSQPESVDVHSQRPMGHQAKEPSPFRHEDVGHGGNVYGGEGVPRLVALKCPHCPQQLSNPDDFRQHLADSHPTDPAMTTAGGLATPRGAGRGRRGRGGRRGAGAGRGQVLTQPGHIPPGEEEKEPVYCHVCDKPFKEKRYFQAHYAKFHAHHEEGEVLDQLQDGLGQGAVAEEEHSQQQMPRKKRGRPRKHPLPEEAYEDPAAGHVPPSSWHVEMPSSSDQRASSSSSAPSTTEMQGKVNLKHVSVSRPRPESDNPLVIKREPEEPSPEEENGADAGGFEYVAEALPPEQADQESHEMM